jgi:ribosomal protein L11 methyltransferase
LDEWVQVNLRFLPAHKETAWALLYQFDCIGIEEIEPDQCRAYFPPQIDTLRVLACLRRSPVVSEAQAAQIQSKDWQRQWMDSYHSFQVGPFLIRPSWEVSEPPPGPIEIAMDPKGAFGTGTHATTQLCLKSLPKLLVGKRCGIDLGCGSGILSIAARQFSPDTRVVAVDNDFQACLECLENAQINRVCFPIVCGTFASTRGFADLIVSNLELNALVSLAPEFRARTTPGAILLLSGILQGQENDLRQAYEPAFSLQEFLLQDEWLAFVYQRR